MKKLHYSAEIFDRILRETENYTVDTAVLVVKTIAESSSIRDTFHDPETLATLKVALNVSRVRSYTGKRVYNGPCDAQLILRKHMNTRAEAVPVYDTAPPNPTFPARFQDALEQDALTLPPGSERNEALRTLNKTARKVKLGPAFDDPQAVAPTV
jgi:hypothetical protein